MIPSQITVSMPETRRHGLQNKTVTVAACIPRLAQTTYTHTWSPYVSSPTTQVIYSILIDYTSILCSDHHDSKLEIRMRWHASPILITIALSSTNVLAGPFGSKSSLCDQTVYPYLLEIAMYCLNRRESLAWQQTQKGRLDKPVPNAPCYTLTHQLPLSVASTLGVCFRRPPEPEDVKELVHTLPRSEHA
jgi:hypothetical protein